LENEGRKSAFAQQEGSCDQGSHLCFDAFFKFSFYFIFKMQEAIRLKFSRASDINLITVTTPY
jgi:hypothetical protein